MKKILTLAALAVSTMLHAGVWAPKQAPLMTTWGEKVTAENAHQEYPRPQMVRQEWKNLNGLWNYALTAKDASKPQEINEGQILVPFAIESALSGVQKRFTPEDRLWYETEFTVPKNWRGKRIILHFGAVDYASEIWVNGKQIGTHKGSSDAFRFDVTDALKGSGPQTLVVSVTDPTDTGYQPLGKQKLEPSGIYYTPVSGIWKTVWMEPVPVSHIYSMRGYADIDNSAYHFTPLLDMAAKGQSVRVTVYDGDKKIATMTGAPNKEIIIPIANQKLWSPETPFLYNMKVELLQGSKVIDSIDSYFGMRKISVGKDENGHQRMMLNNKPYFHTGLLDQGWWPDGLLTPPSDSAYIFDIEFAKKAGFNTLRKHIKQESDRFYYHCDRLGMIVWQDAVASKDTKWWSKSRIEPKLPEIESQSFIREFKNLMDQLYNFPSIVQWVIFNEGWGQHDTPNMMAWVNFYDPSRLHSVSGWMDYGGGDLCDIHRYTGPGKIDNAGGYRPLVLGEYGGIGYVVKGSVWPANTNRTHYINARSIDQYESDYNRVFYQLRILKEQGLSAAIYTQITDVEGEVNGIMTYDRKHTKLPVEHMKGLNDKLLQTPVVLKEVMPNSEKEAQIWKYTNRWEWIGDDWYKDGCDLRNWSEGPGFFGYVREGSVHNTPFTEKCSFAHTPKTDWHTSHLWIRREIELDEVPQNPLLNIWYYTEAEVYINGTLVLKVKNRTAPYPHYEYHRFIEGTQNALKKGRNLIAVHCFKPKGTYVQALDLGIYDIVNE